MTFKNYEDAINKFKIPLQIDQDGYYIHETYIKLGNYYKEFSNYKLALENIVKRKELAEERDNKEWSEKAKKYLSEIKEKGNLN